MVQSDEKRGIISISRVAADGSVVRDSLDGAAYSCWGTASRASQHFSSLLVVLCWVTAVSSTERERERERQVAVGSKAGSW